MQRRKKEVVSGGENAVELLSQVAPSLSDDKKLSEGGRRRSGFVRAGALECHAGGWLGKVGLQEIGSKSGQKLAAVAKRNRPARGRARGL